jgi:hypothetical protein
MRKAASRIALCLSPLLGRATHFTSISNIYECLLNQILTEPNSSIQEQNGESPLDQVRSGTFVTPAVPKTFR